MEIRIAITIGIEEAWIPRDSLLQRGEILVTEEGLDSVIEVTLLDLVISNLLA